MSDEPPITVGAVRWLMYVATIVPFVTAAGRAIATGWFPIGDSALLYLRAADVGTDHHPLLGSWSSASRSLGRDINNPGPLYADLIAPFAHVFPPGVGNAIGVALVNVLCIVLAAVAARRIGGPVFETWTLIVSAALAWTMGSELLFDIFQAHALLFPFLCALVLLVGATTGHRFTWPWLVLIWSIVLQTHISYAYIGVVVVTVAVAVAVAWAPPPRRLWWSDVVRSRSLLWSVAVGVVVWIQPVIEQFLGEGQGNLSRLARSAGGTDVAVGFSNAFRMVSAVFALPPWWTRWGFADTILPAGTVAGPDGPEVDVPWLPNPVLATVAYLVVAALLGWCLRWAAARRDRVHTAISVLALAGLLGSVVALGRLTVGSVGLAAHHTRWLFVLALWCHATIGLTVIRWWLARRSEAPSVAVFRRWAPAGGLAVVGVLAVANVPMYTQQHGPLADTEVMPALERIFDQLGPLGDIDPVRYRTDNLRVYEPYSSAIMAEMVERGIEFRVDDEVMVRQLGNRRRADGTEPYTVTQLQGWEAYSYDGADCVFARASDVGSAGEAELAGLTAGLEERVSELDVSAVLVAPEMTDRDRELAASVMVGDAAAIHRAIVEGWFGWWIDHELVIGDQEVLDDLLGARPALMNWVGTTFVLTISPPDGCPG